ncbi:hypothetical protein CKA32_005496 [Geitlerinema sp. FC II]|nr:hypothetical protein CKA32_005496 [Geitlerinema sp. FC II]
MTWAYPRARQQASAETVLPLKVFPVECPYAIEVVLDDGFWPECDRDEPSNKRNS